MPSEYEITYLSDPGLSEDARGDLDASIDSAITKLGGAIADSVPGIRRRLNFPIQKQTVGFARLLNIQLEADKIEQLRTTLKKHAGILRTTILTSSPRTEVTPEMLFKAPVAEMKTKETPFSETKKSDGKPVSAEAVEKGIEEALQEEVK